MSFNHVSPIKDNIFYNSHKLTAALCRAEQRTIATVTGKVLFERRLKILIIPKQRQVLMAIEREHSETIFE